MNKEFVVKNRHIILLFCIITIQIIYLSCMFAINKQGFHSDELWNYGYANSSEGAHIFMSVEENETFYDLKNMNSWQNSKLLNDYITVSKAEMFDYGSVIHNVAMDFNPPLGYMMLHFICSFFPDTWSKWYCFFLNMVCFAITQIYMAKLIFSITKSKNTALCGVFFYGFTTAALDVAMFLRIYSPALMFGVMVAYYASEIYEHRHDDKTSKKRLLKLALSVFAGCYTLSLFFAYAGVLTAMYCVYYLFTKKFKILLQYGFTTLVSALVAFFAYSRNVANVMMFLGIGEVANPLGDVIDYSNTFGADAYPPHFQFKIYLSYLTNDLFGISTSPWETMTLTYVMYGMLAFIILIIPFAFIFRNEICFGKIAKKTCLKFIGLIKNTKYTLVVIIVTIGSVLFINSRRTSIFGMGRVSNRYIFIVYPIAAVLVSVLVFYLLKTLVKKTVLRIVMGIAISLAFITLSIILAPKPYYFKHKEEGTSLSKIEENADCVVVLSEDWLMTCMTNEIKHTNRYYGSNYTTIKVDDIEKDYDGNGPLYLILDTSGLDKGDYNEMTLFGAHMEWKDQVKDESMTRKEYIKYIEQFSIVKKCNKVGVDSIFGREVEIYRLN